MVEEPDFNPEEIDEREIVETDDPDWVKEGRPEASYTFELFLSTDGKHTVHLVVKDPKFIHEALMKATERYDYIVTRYGTKQAQAVREYKNNGGEKRPDQATCKHTFVKFVQSKTEKNPGRWFKSCKDCNKFLGWQS